MSISGAPFSSPQCHYIGTGIWKWRFFFGFWLEEEFLALSFAFAGAEEDELEAASPDVLEALSFNWVGAGAGTSLGFTAASAERGAG